MMIPLNYEAIVPLLDDVPARLYKQVPPRLAWLSTRHGCKLSSPVELREACYATMNMAQYSVTWLHLCGDGAAASGADFVYVSINDNSLVLRFGQGNGDYNEYGCAH